MNRLIWLLAMYVLVLTGIPCPDSACHAHAVATTGTPAAGVPASHDDAEEHEAPCSPFCHCATCVGFTVPQPLLSVRSVNPSIPLLPRRLFAYQSIRPDDVAHSFWQPPKR